ncbi:MAG: hypothetical protein ACFB50_04950 [Rubrobacteraceae bacterium]
MSITSKGRRWEILHSFWIGWTFTLGFFNWIGFLYVGIRARQRKWIMWGVFYSSPFVLAMIFSNTLAFEGWVGDLIIALILFLGLVSIFHAFRIRKEYLVRLNAVQEGATKRDAALKRQIEIEYRGDASEERSSQAVKISEPNASLISNRDQTNRSSPSEGRTETSPSATSRPSLGDSGKNSTDSLDVRTGLTHSLESYPLPLAFGYGLLKSKWDSRERYREQLRFAENVLAFLASVSLATLQKLGHEVAEIDVERYWQGGISPGDWREITGRCSRVFAKHENYPLAAAIQRLNIRSEKKGFGKDIGELIRKKNDYKHDRGPIVEEDIVVASNEVQEKLERCIESLAFFTEYPIRLVQDFDVSRCGSEFVLKCLRYTGDGPGFPQEKITFHKALPRGDLFLDLGYQDWLPLYPFVTAMNCPRCKSMEIYFIDGWDKKKRRVWLKSFERGHTEERSDIAEVLEVWGNRE